MKPLLLSVFLVAAALAAACGGDSDEEDTSLTAEPSSRPPTTMSTDEIITLTQELPVLYQVNRPDGAFELKPSTINTRVDVLCADDPRWSAEDKGREWRVYAECKKDQSASGGATPPPYGFETLSFEWIFYPDSREVLPVSQAAHDAQYAYPQPSTIPPIPIPTPTR